ncbi:MAG: Asp-tRNA(Asn)/Glu-tRNA(Gln) amidotransferase subunit GatC [Patescibacteria group bacterium]
MTQIDKKTLEHLADLARIKITEKEEDKLVEDLKKILNFFEELRELDTEKIPPMAGGTDLKNTTREDETNKELVKNRDILINSFPEKEDDFLKIPPVFE